MLENIKRECKEITADLLNQKNVLWILRTLFIFIACKFVSGVPFAEQDPVEFLFLLLISGVAWVVWTLVSLFFDDKHAQGIEAIVLLIGSFGLYFMGGQMGFQPWALAFLTGCILSAITLGWGLERNDDIKNRTGNAKILT